MRKRILSVFILLMVTTFTLFGCREDVEEPDLPIISDGTFKVGALLPAEDSSTQLIEDGIFFANSLANSVNIGETVDVIYNIEHYNNSDDVKTLAESLIVDGVAVIIYGGDDYGSFSEFTDYINKTNIPVISLSPYSYEADNFYSVSLNSKYLSSCAATYAMEKGYTAPAIILESSEKYFSDFADTYKSTLRSYTSVEPTAYYNNGELKNYNPNLLSNGSYDYIFIVCSQNSREYFVDELRDAGFTGEIMLTEVIDKTFVQNTSFNNCSIISKFEPDSTNNVATVFYTMYSEQNNVSENDVSPAVAYGYDAYMIAFEALKSFAVNNNSLFQSTTETEASTSVKLDEINTLLYSEAIGNLAYLGVTDLIIFENNSAIPTYIYVDNIINSEIVFGSKYTFASDNT